MSSHPRCLAVAVVLLSLLALFEPSFSQTTTSPSFFTPATINAQTPSAAAQAKLKKYTNFVVIYLENQSFDYLFGSYPGANGIPKALLSYRPQVDFAGNVLATLPPCGNADVSTCGFPSNLPNVPFEGSQYIPVDQTTTFDPTHAYYNEQFQLNGGLSNRYATPTTAGYPQVSTAGAWVMAYYNLSQSYLFSLAQNYTLLDNHFHPSFGNSFCNQYHTHAPHSPPARTPPPRMLHSPSHVAHYHLPAVLCERSMYLVSGRLPYFNNSAAGCAAQPNYVTAVDSTGSAFFSGNTLNRCTPDGKVFATTYPPSYPPQAYSPTSPTVLQGFVTSGPVPTTPVAGSPLLSFIMPSINTPTIGDAMDAQNISWAYYAQYYNNVLAANFSGAPGFAYHHLPFAYFSKFANLSSPYARAHQADDSVFFSKLAAGTLEQVSFVKPSDSDSFHPSSSNIGNSSPYLQRVMDAIFASPQYANGSMLVYISFDENGGLWDHVPPYKGDVDGPATRIPGLVISPDHAGGRINSLPYDDMAFIQMLERRFNLATILQANRSAVTRDFTNSFDDITRPAQWSWTPQHVRSSFAAPGSHAVSWDTPDAYLPIGTHPRVYYGSSPSKMTQMAVGNTTTYFGSSMVFHHVVLTGLLPHTTYYYTCLFQNVSAVPYYTLTTARTQGDATPNQLIGLVGDLGWDPSAAATTQRMVDVTKTGTVDFWMHIGDLSYADVWPTHVNNSVYVYDQIFEIFMDNIAPVTQLAPYHVLPGNHEASCYSSKASACVILSNNFSAYDARWRMPGAESGGYHNMWYSFDSGLIHWVIFDTETDFPNAPDYVAQYNAGPFTAAGTQTAWLQADLIKANANRANVPFIIAAGHRPWIVFDVAADSCTACAAAFHELLVAYNVDLVLHGHVHRYERSFQIGSGMRVTNNATSLFASNSTGSIFVVMGNAGNTNYHSVELGVNASWTKVFDDIHYGYALLTVNTNTATPSLTYTMMDAATNNALDTFTVQAKPAAINAAAVGDPQLIGFLGQSFQVHGVDGQVYSLISDREVSINARFVFRAEGQCPPSDVVTTQCWSHPGSYFGSVGVRTAAGGRVQVDAGAAKDGFLSVTVDEQTVSWSEADGQQPRVESVDVELSLELHGSHSLVLSVGVYELRLTNSDHFMNLQVRVKEWKRLTSELKPHGLLGQTWRYASTRSHSPQLKEVEGWVDDYAELSNDLLGTQFVFNRFDLKQQQQQQEA